MNKTLPLPPAASARTRERAALLPPRVLYKVLVYGLLAIGSAPGTGSRAGV